MAGLTKVKGSGLATGAATDSLVGIDDSATSTAITIDSSENVGIGVVPEAWSSSYKVLQIGDKTSLTEIADRSRHMNNVYEDTSANMLRLSTSLGASRYDQYDGEHIFKVAGTGTGDIPWTTAMTIDNSGAVTMPKQPAARLHLSEHFYPPNSTEWTTIPFAVERFDQGGDFDVATYAFTAPVTGKYTFGYLFRLGSPQTATAYYQIRLVTSNETIYVWLAAFGQMSGNPNYWTAASSILADMDAGDTAYMQILQPGGTADVTFLHATQSFLSVNLTA